MMKKTLTPSEARDMIVSKLSHNFGVIPTEATDEHYYKAIALILRDMMSHEYATFTNAAEAQNKRLFTISVWSSLWVVLSKYSL